MRFDLICRGGVEVGMGHIYRAKAFAQAALKLGHAPRIIAIIPPSLEYLFDTFSECRFVRNDTDIITHISDGAAQAVVFDTIVMEQSAFKQIESLGVPLFSISPVFEHMSRMALYFCRCSPTAEYPQETARYGLPYTIIRDEVERIDEEDYLRHLVNENLQIGIAMGGGDALNKTLAVLRSLSKVEARCSFWVMLGDAYSHSCDELMSVIYENRQHNVLLAKNHSSIWALLRNCSVTILTGGVTVSEAVFAGIPALLIFDREKDMDVVPSDFLRVGACQNLGLIEHGAIESLAERILYLNRHREKLMLMRKASKDMLDKYACNRILEDIECYMAQRPAGS